MAKITAEEIRKLGSLARIALKPGEVKNLSSDLESILDYVAQLQAVDTKNVVETSQVTGLADVWREDEIKESGITRDELLKNAAQTKDGYIKVKRVL